MIKQAGLVWLGCGLILTCASLAKTLVTYRHDWYVSTGEQIQVIKVLKVRAWYAPVLIWAGILLAASAVGDEPFERLLATPNTLDAVLVAIIAVCSSVAVMRLWQMRW